MGTDRRRNMYATAAGLLQARGRRLRRTVACDDAAGASLAIPREKGYRIYPRQQFPEVEDVLADVGHWIGQGGLQNRKQDKKAQLNTGNINPSELTAQSSLVRLALRQDVLEAVSLYLETVPVLAGVDIWCSVFAAGSPVNSQLYHCDWADRTQIKLFVFCDDVTEENGPLVVLDAESSARVRQHLNYTYASRVSDEVMYGLVERGAAHALTGPKGTVAMVDTSRCFHYGSRVKPGAAPRILAKIQYLTPTTFRPVLSPRAVVRFNHLATPEHTRFQRLVLGVDVAKRPAA